MNNLDVVKYAIASTSKYDYSLKQINKKYIQLKLKSKHVCGCYNRINMSIWSNN